MISLNLNSIEYFLALHLHDLHRNRVVLLIANSVHILTAIAFLIYNLFPIRSHFTFTILNEAIKCFMESQVLKKI